MHYFFYNITGDDLNKTIEISKNNYLYKQFTKVLKFKKKENIILLNNTNNIFQYEISEINSNFLKLNFIKKTTIPNKLFHLHLFIAIGKKDKLEFICQKSTELGVSEITPIITQRTIKLNFNKKRLESIALEAIEQSHQNKLIKINEKIHLNSIDYKRITQNDSINLILDIKAKKNIFNLKNNLINKKNINIFIGPEGGWTEKELKTFNEWENTEIIKISKNVLRMETAAIAVIAIINNYLNN